MDHVTLLWVCPKGLRLLEGVFATPTLAEWHARDFLAPGTPVEFQRANSVAFFVRPQDEIIDVASPGRVWGLPE